MSREPDKQQRLQHEAEHTRPHKKVSVMGYLAILFAAAFLLLLLSYFMQQRSSQQTISGLKDSVSALQSVEDLIADNHALHDQVDELERQVSDLQGQLTRSQHGADALQSQADRQKDALAAMDWLWRIQRAWSRGARGEARDLVDQFEATGLPSSLPDEALSGVDGPTPAQQYDALLDALNYRPEP